jgi:hypothetical protein
MNLVEHMVRQLTFSGKTFGPGSRLGGVTDHIRKELIELGGPPDDLENAILSRNSALALRIATHRAMKRGQVEKPGDPKEWVDVVLLALDGLWRAIDEEANGNLTAQEIAELVVELIEAKQAKNEARDWPDWRTMSADRAIEHDRSAE